MLKNILIKPLHIYFCSILYLKNNLIFGHNVYIPNKVKPSAGKSRNLKSSHGSTKPSPVSSADLIKKKACIASKVLSKTCQNLRRDSVDEKCARLGITYLKWKGQKGPGMHVSHVPVKKALFKCVPKGPKNV